MTKISLRLADLSFRRHARSAQQHQPLRQRHPRGSEEQDEPGRLLTTRTIGGRT
jgi:hypothetical protein